MRKLFIFIAVLMCMSVIAAPPVMAAGTLAGTSISNQAYSDYKDANGNDMSRVFSNTVTVTVTQVAAVSTSPETETHNGIPGTNISFPVTVCNDGNGSDTITLSAVNASGWTVILYRDDNGDGIWDPSETTVVTNTGVVAVDACFKVIAVVAVPAGAAEGTISVTTLTATSTYDGSVSDSSTLTANVQAASLILTKTASTSTPQPGDIITYAIAGSNAGSGFAYNVRAIDNIPANTTYVAGSMKAGPVGGAYADAYPMTDANDAENLTYTDGGNTTIANAYYDSGNNRVQLDWSQCLPAGVFYFQVRVNDNVASGTNISNYVTANYSLLSDDMTRPYIETSNSAISAVQNYPGVLLSPDRSGSYNPGDQVVYAFTVQNTGNNSDTVDLTFSSTSGWTWVIWKDVDGNGIPGTDGDTVLTDTDADGVIDTGILAQGGAVSLLAVTTVPAGISNGSVDTTVITGASSTTTSVTSSVTMTTTVKAPVLSVTKSITAVQAPDLSVCNPTNPATGAGCTFVPGSVITYQVSVINNGAGNATAVAITDMIPTYTTYVAGSIRTGVSTGSLAARTDASDGDGGRFEGNAIIAGGTGGLTLGPSGTWVLEFKTEID